MFDYLYLDDDEYLFCEVDCTYALEERIDDEFESPPQPTAPPALHALLEICSHGLYIVPTSAAGVIMRLAFDGDARITSDGTGNIIWTGVRRITIDRNGRAPYETHEGDQRVVIALANKQPALDLLLELWNVAQRRLAATNGSTSHKEEAKEDLSTIIANHEGSLEFNDAALGPEETILLKLRARRLSPLVERPGWLVLTCTAVYFQPYAFQTKKEAALRAPLTALVRVARCKHMLRDVALELYFEDMLFGPETLLGSRSLLVAVSSQRERAALESAILSHASVETPPLTSQSLKYHTREWSRGRLSNYEYIMALNEAAGRSFNDLSQYPIMPWIIRDYASTKLDFSDESIYRDLSRPIVALSQTRVRQGREMYATSLRPRHPTITESEPPWQHGSHYSYPGGVIFYIVRACPQLMLRLQGGRFDAPDRLFCSVADAWESILRWPSDVKELIPEFYTPSAIESIFNNATGANFGTRSSGEAIVDVELPPWAGSAVAFAALMRDALESPAASSNLHKWIDLVFGCKSRGKAAADVDNLFHYITYDET
jgi:factor associated with neutral sphingomyelinase activation